MALRYIIQCTHAMPTNYMLITIRSQMRTYLRQRSRTLPAVARMSSGRISMGFPIPPPLSPTTSKSTAVATTSRSSPIGTRRPVVVRRSDRSHAPLSQRASMQSVSLWECHPRTVTVSASAALSNYSCAGSTLMWSKARAAGPEILSSYISVGTARSWRRLFKHIRSCRSVWSDIRCRACADRLTGASSTGALHIVVHSLHL